MCWACSGRSGGAPLEPCRASGACGPSRPVLAMAVRRALGPGVVRPERAPCRRSRRRRGGRARARRRPRAVRRLGRQPAGAAARPRSGGAPEPGWQGVSPRPQPARRRGGDPRHDRRRARQPHHGVRGLLRRDVLGGLRRPALRRSRHRLPVVGRTRPRGRPGGGLRHRPGGLPARGCAPGAGRDRPGHRARARPPRAYRLSGPGRPGPAPEGRPALPATAHGVAAELAERPRRRARR